MNMTRADPTAKTLAVFPKARKVRAVISTIHPDRAGDIVVPKGLKNLDEYLSNPVVLWNHQRQLPPIGTCVALWLTDTEVIAETQFAETRLADELFELYAKGFLRGWSIGFRPTKAVPTASGGHRFYEWELLEYSAVPIPENPQALTLAVQKGLVTDPLLKMWIDNDILSLLF